MPGLEINLILAIVFLSTAVGIGVFVIAKNPAAKPPRLGLRGLKRHQAIAEGGGFAIVEPLVRVVAAWISHVPVNQWRRKLDVRLGKAGDYLGLSADELMAMCLLSSMVGFGASLLLGLELLFVVLVMLFCGYLPIMAVSSAMEKRCQEINRSLPTAIDLAALCMSAGLDFPGALRRVSDKDVVREDALTEEFQRILQELDLGHSRRRALQAFSERVDSEAVHDFVAAVVQAEAKGNPLAQVLRIQADVLRTKRSQNAEEAASKASVQMVAPLVLLLISSMLLVLGPMLIKTMQGFDF